MLRTRRAQASLSRVMVEAVGIRPRLDAALPTGAPSRESFWRPRRVRFQEIPDPCRETWRT
jgi:hypothetical protein